MDDIKGKRAGLVTQSNANANMNTEGGISSISDYRATDEEFPPVKPTAYFA